MSRAIVLTSIVVGLVSLAACGGQPAIVRPSPTPSVQPGIFSIVGQPMSAGRVESASVFAQCLAGSGVGCFQKITTAGVHDAAPLAAVGAPQNFTATASGSTVTLMWMPPAPGGDPLTGYLIEAGSASGLSDLASFSTGNTLTTYSASGVGAGTYFVRVRSQSGAAVGSPSNEARLVVGGGGCVAPGAPGTLSGSVSGTTVTLTWSTASGSPTSYVIEAGSSSGTSNLVVSDTGSAATSLTATAGDGTYYVRVRARNTCGTSSASNEIVVTIGSSASQACQQVVQSFAPYTGNGVSVTCDATYAYVNTFGLQFAHPMMDGITQTILQVPLAQNFTGTNAWRIPLAPTLVTPTSVVDGPVGVAVNGIPMFNPCKQGGCGAGDTKLLGELDVCNGHAGRADDYHYHAAPNCLMQTQGEHYWDTHPVGWALDGYGIYGYNDADGSAAVRDGICGGNTKSVPASPAGYAYHVTDVSPYVMSCLRGAPSPDLAGQGGKFAPLRVPGDSPIEGAGGGPGVSNMHLESSAASLAMNGTSRLTWSKGGDQYEIRYTRTSDRCWNFVFFAKGVQTGTAAHCRAF